MEVIRKSGQEEFCNGNHRLEFRLSDFWQWSQSDVLNNTLRGILAEFIVCRALEVDSLIRLDWDAFDLLYEGFKIEVKSSAYVQSWSQERPSKISFDIRPTKSWCEKTKRRVDAACRQSDYYIFCLLEHQDRQTINPLNMMHWSFYILATDTLNAKIPDQKTISLNSLLALEPVKCSFNEIKCVFDRLTTNN